MINQLHQIEASEKRVINYIWYSYKIEAALVLTYIPSKIKYLSSEVVMSGSNTEYLGKIKQ